MIYFFLINDENSITTYSGRLFANGMRYAGFEVKIIDNDQEKTALLATIKNGTIIFQKCSNQQHQAAQISHLKGKVSLIHIDDDWMDMNNKGHLETLQMTDLILVGSKEHQKALAQFTKTPCVQIRALPDFKNFPYLPFAQRSNNPLIISWQQSCADGYINDLLSIAQSLIELKKCYDFRLCLFGWHLGIGYPDLRARVVNSLPFAELIAYVPLARYFSEIVPEISHSDIFIVPYVDQPSRQGKGGFGTKRVMMLGVPVIGSAVGPNLEIIEDGVTGYLARNESEWKEKLEQLLWEPNLRQKFSENARHLMETDYSYENCLKIFIQAINPYLR